MGTFLVTGVSRRKGIGYAVARRLQDAGHELVLHGWEPHDAGQPWGAEPGALTAIAGELGARHVSADLADPAAPARIVQDAGPLDGIVANHARSVAHEPFSQLTADEVDLSYAVNVRSTLLLVKEFAAQGRPGRVVLFTSGQHDGPMPAEIPYAASKAALAGITKSLAAALAPQRITVNCVNPGPTDTGWATPEITAEALGRLPFGRWGAPDDAARLVAWLVGPDGGWVTGQVISSDGGFGVS